MPHRITLKDFQSFDESGAGLLDVGRINILVGPNNAGKSKILRAVDRTINGHKKSLISKSSASYSIEVDRRLSEEERRRIFPEDTQYLTLGNAWTSLGMHLTDAEVSYSLHGQDGVAFKEARYSYAEKWERWDRHLVNNTIQKNISEAASRGWLDRFSEPVYYITAERDVKPEAESGTDDIQPDGTGVTNLFRRLLTTAGVSKEPIEKWLLEDLNRILAPDHVFSRIQILQHPTDRNWEIFLEEKGKGLIPLSQCGSGLRTVIHFLACTNLVAQRAGGKIAKGTFLFEELENCLHPHVQRNLFSYLNDVVGLPARVFLTTHSSVCLDFFQGNEDAILTQIYQENGRTRSRQIDAFNDQCGTLDRLGSKASDALQSNAVVWVEGPSDRIYLKKWLELVGSDLREGRDFSIMFYGGAILSHLSMSVDQETDEYVRLLRINRNSAILMDSDKKAAEDALKERVQRVKDEAEKEARLVWITSGKEIENYICGNFAKAQFTDAPEIGQFDAASKALTGIHPQGSARGLQSKIALADYVVSRAGPTDFILDWKERTEELVRFLKRANLRP